MKSTGSTAKTKLSRESVLNNYMDAVLEGKKPENVYLFSKQSGFSETEFYQFYSSFEAIEAHFFEVLFDKTLETIHKSPAYADYVAKEKLLSFYYTFFGNMTQNRSFILYLLPSGKPENLRKLKGLRKKFLAYVKTLDVDKLDLKSDKLNKMQDRAMQEGAWVQLLTILRYWLKDESADFEKTDILIEKSVNAGFELINTRPLESMLDLGKFIFKEMSPM